MNSQKKLLIVSRGISKLTHCFRGILFAFAVMTVLHFFALPSAGAYVEDYISGDFSYQGQFNNDDGLNYLAYMDAVYFAGYHSLLFTVHNSNNATSTSKLYWRTVPCATTETCYGSVDIGNSTELNFRFKTVVLNDILFVFYTPSQAVNDYSTNRIYYRTASIDYGSDGNGRGLLFSSEKSIPGVTTTSLNIISFAAMMNGRMYIIFTSGNDWYYISSQDGLTFGPATLFYSSSSDVAILGPAGTVFYVPDATEGWKERMMISYCPYREDRIIKYFFFDGETVYGENDVATQFASTPLLASSVRLFTGTAQGYSNDKYAIQAFIASTTNTDSSWSNIYHAQYVPSGPNGDQGTWSAWNLLNKSSDDTIRCSADYSTDPDWTIVPNFSDPYLTGNPKMLLTIYYSKGTNSDIRRGYDTIEFRDSWFYSDYMKHDPDQDRTAQAGAQDLSSSMIVGVIEGTPPFPINGGVPTALNTNTSIVDLTKQTTYTTATTWSVGGSVALSFGVKEPGEGAFLGKLSAGLKSTQEIGRSDSTTTLIKLYSFTDNTTLTPKENPGDLGWLMVLKPEIVTSQYIVTAFDGNPLTYCYNSDCSSKTTEDEEMRLILITWGPGSFIELLPYYLQNPSDPIGDDPINGSRTLLEGMAARPLSTDLAAWQQIYHHDPSYYLSTNLPTVPGSLNVQVNETFSETVNNAHTWSANAGFSASAKKMGLINFGEELNINFSMDVKTTTVMSYSLGFWLNLPGCTQTGCCISELDIDPAIYVPNDEASGYNAPWISNDIRNFQKPKPWCLSYEILNPINPCPSGVGSTPSRLTVRKLEGTLFLDQNDQNRNKVSVKLRLEGIAPDFSLDDPEVVYMRLGNYAVNSDRNYVVSWYFKGKDLVLKLKETEESKSSLLVKLSYDSRKSILDIDLNADRIDLIHLFQSYGLGTGDEVPEHQDKTVPLRFFLGDRYVADAEMNTRCTTNNQHVICNLHSK